MPSPILPFDVSELTVGITGTFPAGQAWHLCKIGL